MTKHNKIKKQHFVPRFYLKNFSLNGQTIEVLDKDNLMIYGNNIMDISSRNYFHDIDFIAEDPQAVEKLLGKYEYSWNINLGNIIVKLKDIKSQFLNNKTCFRSIELSAKEKINLAQFAAMQWLRTEKQRKIISEIHSMVKDLSVGQNNNFSQDELTRYLHIKKMLTNFETFAEYLLEQKWFFGINISNMSFYTSDNPLVFDSEFCNTYRGVGFKTSGLQYYFPLNSSFILYIIEKSLCNTLQYKDKTNSIFYLNKEMVLYSNTLQINQALFQIYSNTSRYFQDDIKYLKNTKQNGSKDRSFLKPF